MMQSKQIHNLKGKLAVTMRTIQRLFTLLVRAWFHPIRYGQAFYARVLPYCAGRHFQRGSWQLDIQRWLPDALRFPVVVTTRREKLHLYISRDPVDVKIAVHIQTDYHASYFPSAPIALPAAPTILELGAHHGFYTVHALAVYPQSKIICVEPNVASIRLLKRNLALNGWLARARIVQAGLAATSATGYLALSKAGSWGDSLFETVAQTRARQEVALLTLADILQDAQPAIVKCNAEGAEFELVRQLLAMSWRPTLASIAVHAEFGDSRGLLAAMQQAGYQMMQTGEEHRPFFHFWKA